MVGYSPTGMCMYCTAASLPREIYYYTTPVSSGMLGVSRSKKKKKESQDLTFRI